MSTGVVALGMPGTGDWVRYKLMPASESVHTAADRITITVGKPGDVQGAPSQWWQMLVEKPDGTQFVVQALSERVPMAAENGDIGPVYRYIFRQGNQLALEYANKPTGLAQLPMFGFRDALIPTPRSRVGRAGAFLSTGNYLGQALAAHAWGKDGKWIDLEPVKKLLLDDDVLIGTARMFKDDGKGPGEDKEYKYVELTPDDYDRMVQAGFNLFMVYDKHADYVRDRSVFFIKWTFGKDPFPEMLYRSNFWGTAMFTDEPGVRMDPADCRTVYDAANLLRLRNYTYHLSPNSHADQITRMIREAGFNMGDWNLRQLHIPVWETAYESAFYQMQGGAAGMAHEGRYRLAEFNALMGAVLGPGVDVTVPEMYDLYYCFMRGAARCFPGKEWGTAIYGQCDYTIAPDAVKQAYDMGARYIWFWTSDHDHHLTHDRQLELAGIVRAHQQQNPRGNRREMLRSARVAVAIPDGYICGWGTQWSSRFRADKLNEFGAPYGDINAEAYWQMYRLAKQGVDFDALIDVPEVIDRAGYERIIRIGLDGRANLPDPRMPGAAPKVTVKKAESLAQYEPKTGAPRTTAAYIKPGSVQVDADLAEWKGAHWIDLKEQFMYEVTHEKWGGESDLSAKVAFAYDDEALYVAAQVRDDVMAAEERDELIWQNDCLQVAFDPFFNPHSEGYYAIDDTEVGFSLVDGKPYAHRWTPAIAGAPSEVPGADVAILRKGDATVYEARVPFSSLSPLTPSFPGRCGMSAALNDSDGKLRKGSIAWTSGLADGKNPSRFGVLEFEGASKLKNPAPIAFAQAERTVVKRGQDILLRLDTGSRDVADAELAVIVRHNNARTPESIARFKVPAGMSRFQVSVDTSGLESDSYKADLVVTTGAKTAIMQSIRFYVLP